MLLSNLLKMLLQVLVILGYCERSAGQNCEINCGTLLESLECVCRTYRPHYSSQRAGRSITLPNMTHLDLDSQPSSPTLQDVLLERKTALSVIRSRFRRSGRFTNVQEECCRDQTTRCDQEELKGYCEVVRDQA